MSNLELKFKSDGFTVLISGKVVGEFTRFLNDWPLAFKPAYNTEIYPSDLLDIANKLVELNGVISPNKPKKE